MELNTAANSWPKSGKVHVDVGDLAVMIGPEGVLIAYALGSCIGVAVHDPHAGVSGLAHIQLPCSQAPNASTTCGKWAYADQALPELFHRCYEAGACKNKMKVVIAGGGTFLDPQNFFQIGRKNTLMVKKLLWQNGVFVTAERTGGTEWRTLSVNAGTGETMLKTPDKVEVF
jgi:chemotaxis protein CheD